MPLSAVANGGRLKTKNQRQGRRWDMKSSTNGIARNDFNVTLFSFTGAGLASREIRVSCPAAASKKKS
jgi:hypothetical protein